MHYDLGTSVSCYADNTKLVHGIYYSAIDDIWESKEATFAEYDWESIRRTIDQVKKIKEYKVVIEAIDNTEEQEPALKSGRSSSTTGPQAVDILGNPGLLAQWAHLIPHNPSCSVAYGPVAQMALGHAFKIDENDKKRKHQIMVVGALSEKKQRVAGSGIKHNKLNKVNLSFQKELMDLRPCILIVPILTLDDTKSWKSGDGYSALVCVGSWESHSAAQLYSKLINSKMPFCENQELQCATELLACFTKALAYSLSEGHCFEVWDEEVMEDNGDKKDSVKNREQAALKRVQASLKQSMKVSIPLLPQGNCRVAKVVFSASNAGLPDPYLLAVKASVIWSWRNGQKLLPGCGPEEEECSECERMDEYAEYLYQEEIRASSLDKITRGFGLDEIGVCERQLQLPGSTAGADHQ
jgi:hypothetical protein